MPLLDMNMNMNMNMGFAASTPSGRSLHPRFNSDVESRLINLVPPSNLVPPAAGVAPNYPFYHTNWDADLRAYMYLDDFLGRLGADAAAVAAAVPGATAADVENAVAAAAAAAAAAQGVAAAAAAVAGATAADVADAVAAAGAAGAAWRAAYNLVARNGGIPPHEMTRVQLGAQVLRVLELGLEREARFAEIIDQDSADGAINYWLGMLKIDPARHPATNLMVYVGRRIGEHVSMCLKGDFRSPRPSQVCPAITPMIDPPVTSSFPAGHAVQSYLISYLLAYSLADAAGATNLPHHQLPPAASPLADFLAPGVAPRGPLFNLARRVAQNRIVAGIHYPTDIRAGRAVATQIFLDIQRVDSIWDLGGLRGAVQAEFPQYAP
jgi:membrane-associated phospholipid phosphatase